MKSRILALSSLGPLILSAQALRDVAPLKYWPAPLYWQPTHAESRVVAKSELFGVPSEPAPAQTPPNSLVFVAITPCRLVDTRAGFGFTGFFGPPSLAGSGIRNFPIQSSTTCTIPAIAQAYSLNLTVVPPGPLTYLTIWPGGASQPNASALNDTLGGIVANATIVPAGADASGSVNVFVSDNTNLIIDINGYYAPQSGITLTQGNAGAPSLSFAGDSGTGVFSSGAGTVNISTSGTNRLSVRSDGDVDIPGSIRKNGTLFLHNLGTQNTAIGISALNPSSTGGSNTATGYQSLQSNTTGTNNTATGHSALSSNTVGASNAAFGDVALSSNISGSNNTASGFGALFLNGSGGSNTATGSQALVNNTTGSSNTASGAQASFSNGGGNNNTATGAGALASSVSGSSNTAVGYQALFNSLASNNTAIGIQALFNNSTGTNNIAIGVAAGSSVSSGNSNNIHVGALGSSADASTIRIGSGQTSFFTAGVRGVTTGTNNAVPVLIDTNGQMGTVSSYNRFKEDVQDMADSSGGLLRLRPVTYRYKQPYADGSKPVDYGLIAEEVAEVYPDLVVRGTDGQVETVQYQKLTPMLLNELQKEIARQREENRKLEDRLATLEKLVSAGRESH